MCICCNLFLVGVNFSVKNGLVLFKILFPYAASDFIEANIFSS